MATWLVWVTIIGSIVGAAGIGYLIYWLIKKYSGDDNEAGGKLTIEKLLDLRFQVYEWAYNQKAYHDNLINEAFRYLAGKDNVVRKELLWFITKPEIWDGEDRCGRYASLVLLCFDWCKDVLTDEEQGQFLARAREAAWRYKKELAVDADKQMTSGPVYAFLGGEWPDGFIETNYTPHSLEGGSSHYGPLGEFMLILKSYLTGMLSQDHVRQASDQQIGLFSIARYGVGREYYNCQRGASFSISLMLLLMWLTEDGWRKSNIKWLVERRINWLKDNGHPIYACAPLFAIAGWDKVTAKKPDWHSHRMATRRATIKGKPQIVYLRENWNSTAVAEQLIAVRSGFGNGEWSVILDMAPAPNAKGDRNRTGSIVSIDGPNNMPLLNSFPYYFSEYNNEQSFSVAENNGGYGGQIVGWDTSGYCHFRSGGWNRVVEIAGGKLTITDTGGGKVYYHLVRYEGYQIDGNVLTMGGMVWEFRADSVNITERQVGDIEKGGMVSAVELFIELGGNNIVTTVTEE